MPEHSRRPSPSSQACSAWRSGSAIGVCARNSISTTRSSTTDVPILDSQVHAYERNHPGRSWFGTLYGPPEVTGDQMVAAMDAVGVDGAILASPSACIATTGQLHPNVFAAHPSRFSWSSRPIRPTPPSTGVLATIRSVIGLSPSSSLLPSRSGRISGSGAIPAIYQTAIERQDLPLTGPCWRERATARSGGRPTLGSALTLAASLKLPRMTNGKVEISAIAWSSWVMMTRAASFGGKRP